MALAVMLRGQSRAKGKPNAYIVNCELYQLIAICLSKTKVT